MANFTGAIFDSETEWLNGIVPVGAVYSGTVTTGYLNFTGATLDDATFSNLNLDGAVFDGASLDGTEFNNVDFKNVDFGDADISELKFDSDTTFDNVTFENPDGGADIVISSSDTNEIIKELSRNLNLQYNSLVNMFGDSVAVGEALADPYIYPMRSSIPVKLPDAEACIVFTSATKLLSMRRLLLLQKSMKTA